ncbi:MAG TPA: response regulator [Candidatus Polarisedimenticolaceae bacterium]|nr:response regulator [Candidatus Polarisedimenticolaceae bacterium]
MMSKILVIEDEKNLRQLYKQDLELDGHTVVTAKSAEEGLKKVETEAPDLVVLDIRMPGMDGLEAMGRILDQHPSIPVLLNTAYSSYQDSFLSWGADAYVIKSSDTGDLRREVEQLLTGKREGARRRPGGQPHAQS